MIPTLVFEDVSVPVVGKIEEPPSLLRESLVARGIETFVIRWNGLFEITLFVEDDAETLGEAVQEIETEGVTRHEVVLGDGSLLISTNIDDGNARVQADYAPYQDVRLSKRYSFEMPVAAYRNAWRRMLAQLQLHAHG